MEFLHRARNGVRHPVRRRRRRRHAKHRHGHRARCGAHSRERRDAPASAHGVPRAHGRGATAAAVRGGQAFRHYPHLHRAGDGRRRVGGRARPAARTSSSRTTAAMGITSRGPTIPTGLLAEVMGKATGVCGGLGGSQHLSAPGFFSNGIQGGIVPVAAGLAFAREARGERRHRGRLHRRRHARRRRRLRDSEHRGEMELAAARGAREQPLCAVDVSERDACRRHLRARRGVRNRDVARRHVAARGSHGSASQRRRDGEARLPPGFRARRHLSPRGALERRRRSRPAGNRSSTRAAIR